VSCIFCEIAQARIAAPVVFEDANSIAFLDHRPIFAGHVLLIPRAHVETLPELPPAENGGFLANVKILCRAVQAAMGSEGTFVGVNNKVSQSVPHLHVHIIPRRRGDGLRGFFWPRRNYHGEEEVRDVQEKVRQAVSRMASPA
jgi:histidine triad (HIT) family protein